MVRPALLAAALLLASAAAWAQPVPTPPTPAPQRPAAPKPPAPPSAAPKPAPPKPGTPTVAPKPGPAAQRPPPQRPAARPPAPAVIPAPIVPTPEPEKPATPTKGSNSGLPLPRFAALRSDEVYLRTGPGPRYPIDWVYKRRDFPLEIEREFDIWRLVRDQEGVRGWVNTQTLSPRRTAVVTGAERVLRRDAKDDAAPVARLKPGVVVRLRSCEAGSEWCQATVGDHRGWMKRTELWGTYPGEEIK